MTSNGMPGIERIRAHPVIIRSVNATVDFFLLVTGLPKASFRSCLVPLSFIGCARPPLSLPNLIYSCRTQATHTDQSSPYEPPPPDTCIIIITPLHPSPPTDPPCAFDPNGPQTPPATSAPSLPPFTSGSSHTSLRRKAPSPPARRGRRWPARPSASACGRRGRRGGGTYLRGLVWMADGGVKAKRGGGKGWTGVSVCPVTLSVRLSIDGSAGRQAGTQRGTGMGAEGALSVNLIGQICTQAHGQMEDSCAYQSCISRQESRHMGREGVG